MAQINVVIVDATGNKEQKVGLPDDVKCGIIMVKLVEKVKLPSVGPDGNPISYKFIHKVSGRQLLEAQTLSEAGVKDGDVLRLQPEITAGAVFCSGCGAQNADETVFCGKCGIKIGAETPIQNNNMPNPIPSTASQNLGNAITHIETIAQKNSKLFPIIGIISGVLSFIFGIITMSQTIGVYVSSNSYGGDAYTGMQNAAAKTANNVQVLSEIVSFGLGALLIILGIALFCYFGMKLKKTSR